MAQKESFTPSLPEDLGFTSSLDLEKAFNMNQRNFETVGEINQCFCKAMQTCNEELMVFGSDRLKKDFAIPQQLAECKTPQDVINVYNDFFQTALKQYTEEATTLAKIANIFTKEAFDSLQHQAGDVIVAEEVEESEEDDTPAKTAKK